MEQTKSKSFLIFLAFIFLIPLFFIPGGALSVPVSKSAIMVLGIILSSLVFLWETWRKNEVSLPSNPILLVTIALPVVYLISALFTTPASLSLFGYNLEIGTFGFVLVVSSILLLTATIVSDNLRALKVLTAFFVSISLVAAFSLIRIFSKGALDFGSFFNLTDGPVGRWTDLATVAGLLSSFSILILAMFPMKKSFKWLTLLVFVASTFLLVILNFYTAFILTLISSVLIFIYFKKYENKRQDSGIEQSVSTPFIFRPTTLAIVLALISVVFLINPKISVNTKLGDSISTYFQVSNIEVRPSFSTTLSISKAALSNDTFLGSGPNTFSQNWLSYKPVGVNVTPFWLTPFTFGIGFIPTQIASTGVLGTLVWLIFLVWLGVLVIRSLYRLPESKLLRFSLISSIILMVYLWIGAMIYAPSATVITFAFLITGIFLALCAQIGVIGLRNYQLTKDGLTKSLSTAVIILVAAGLIYVGYITKEKTLASYHFNKAVLLSSQENPNLDEIETVLKKAAEIYPADIHYVALSRVNFLKAQEISRRTTGSQEENLNQFQVAVSASVAAAREAVNQNPSRYENWIALGSVYSYLVPAPLSVPGAYENALTAFNEANKRNPLSPETFLFLARLESSKNNVDAARSYIRQAITLKEDYAEAYLFLAQLEIQQNNLKDAITSAERLALLIRDNPAIYFELGLLKYSARDFNGAIEAFGLALQLVPDYANAQYYAGLALAQVGRLDDAKQLFEMVLATNPDNAEVKQIVSDLNLGKTTFLKPAN